MTTRVLIAGGGVAALEAALALRDLAEERVAVELLAPEPHFWYRPLSVAEPFGLGEVLRFELGALAAAAGAGFTPGALLGVDAPRRVARTSVGELSYDALLVAVGAQPTDALPGALTFRGPADVELIRGLLDELGSGAARSVAFAVPAAEAWPLPLYELALLTAAHVGAHGIGGVELTVVTPEDAPLELFGRVGSDAVRRLLDERGIGLRTGAHPLRADADGVLLEPDGRVEADRVVSLPRLRGPRLDGIPQTLEGFVPVDAHGRVSGLGGVYAAGDVTTFAVRQGGIATQLADAAAELIAVQAGAELRPEPFRPVLRGLLLTGGPPRYLRRELTGPQTEDAGTEPLWWPPAKIVGRHLAPFLAGLAGLGSPREPAPPEGALEIELDLSTPLPRRRPPRPAGAASDTDSAGMAMADALVVAPGDTLGDVAERMSELDVGSAAVAEGDRLVGIVTGRDLLRAYAARADPREARVCEWMTAEPVAVQVGDPVETALRLMAAHGLHQLPVVDGERPVGLLGFRQASRLARGPAVGLGF